MTELVILFMILLILRFAIFRCRKESLPREEEELSLFAVECEWGSDPIDPSPGEDMLFVLAYDEEHAQMHSEGFLYFIVDSFVFRNSKIKVHSIPPSLMVEFSGIDLFTRVGTRMKMSAKAWCEFLEVNDVSPGVFASQAGMIEGRCVNLEEFWINGGVVQ